MIYRTLLLAAVATAFAAPASAGVTVLGNSDARLCFEAADSPMMPSGSDVRRCDEALQRDNLTGYEVVATHVNRGILRLRRGQVDEAVADFDRAIALDPEQPESYINKGAAMMRRNNAESAVQLFTVALERNTTRPALAHYGRAMAQEELGNVAAAYRDYRRASELAPTWREPQLELTRFRVTSGTVRGPGG
ncbi:MAG TPA: tetratricopeptide repeat protein [Allosphingosinicella sp.]|nr:tetratricopeptide repeat protein [Allosphingosinicella sp.]